ncbi:hypothetical protein P154DRAFT_520912 [Amniculicola lignicola CBS 123094]|uniref:Uncharacterized protein n=1 Tax=Amniculicola lignicola CBS 123094 TaxID=1392246 RepID=A0A6A5WN26_9PLEO|nr:hypothetical protein P154DRAFT_520912 [Amniculicola lignicola CBS 123094]
MKSSTILFTFLPAIVLAQESHASAASTCVAHEDHWDCPSGVPEPTTPPQALSLSTTVTSSHTISLTASGVCEAHDDHWHCPSGVPEPTTPPAHTDDHDHDHEDVASTATACEAHGDHWHCPSGVAEPTTKPATVTTTGTSSATAAAAASQSSGAAALKNGGVPAGTLGFVLGLLGFFGI